MFLYLNIFDIPIIFSFRRKKNEDTFVVTIRNDRRSINGVDVSERNDSIRPRIVPLAYKYIRTR